MEIKHYYEFTGTEIYFIRTLFLKMSQPALATRLKCSVPLICRMENGDRKITSQMSCDLVNLLKKHGNYNESKDGTEIDFLNKCLSFWN